jgi:hypothetical protein
MERAAVSFAFTAIMVRASAGPAAGIVTIDSASVVLVVDGKEEAVVRMPA